MLSDQKLFCDRSLQSKRKEKKCQLDTWLTVDHSDGGSVYITEAFSNGADFYSSDADPMKVQDEIAFEERIR